MEFRGYDYGELAEAWGIDGEMREFCDMWDKNNLYDIRANECPAAVFIAKYIHKNTEFSPTTVIGENIRQDMIDFLYAFKKHKMSSICDKRMAETLIELSTIDEDDEGFYRWFTMCLPMLWN